MPSSRPARPRGFRISTDEMHRLDVEPRVGARFQSELLEVLPALFEVIDLDDHGAVVARVAWTALFDGRTRAL